MKQSSVALIDEKSVARYILGQVFKNQMDNKRMITMAKIFMDYRNMKMIQIPRNICWNYERKQFRF